MTKLFILISSLILLVAAKEGSDTWTVLLNNKVVCKGNADDTEPKGCIKSGAIKPTDKITLKYNAANSNSQWKRSFMVNDESENSYVNLNIDKQSGSVTFSASKIKPLIDKKQTAFIYTISLPKDPKLAAAVRVRRVLLCKLEWTK